MNQSEQDLSIQPTDTMPEAGRKVLGRFLAEMLHQEPKARAGDDIEGVHKMRVATRRMRSAYRVFGDYLPPSYQAKFPQRLRQIANTLGEVRDLDVFLEHLNVYQTENPDIADFSPLFEHLQAEHEAAREKLLKWLDGKKYARFVENFGALLAEPLTIEHLPKGADTGAYAVEVLLPPMIYERYSAVRRHAYLQTEPESEALHVLRIDAKRLRYTLEAFEDVLGVNGEKVIIELKQMQDSLGHLNDAAVGLKRLKALRKGLEADQRAGLEAYKEHLKAAEAAAVAEFPKAWAAFNRYDVRRWLALAVAKL